MLAAGSCLLQGGDVLARVLIKSSWRFPGSVTVPTCIWLALGEGAKFLQHKDQSVSVCQAQFREQKPGRDTTGFLCLPGCCGGVWPRLAPQHRLCPTGSSQLPLVRVLVRLCLFPLIHPDLFVCPLHSGRSGKDRVWGQGVQRTLCWTS